MIAFISFIILLEFLFTLVKLINLYSNKKQECLLKEKIDNFIISSEDIESLTIDELYIFSKSLIIPYGFSEIYSLSDNVFSCKLNSEKHLLLVTDEICADKIDFILYELLTRKISSGTIISSSKYDEAIYNISKNLNQDYSVEIKFNEDLLDMISNRLP